MRFRRSDGEGEYWIDQKSFVLRRMRFGQPATQASGGEPAKEGANMVANFERARLGGAIDDPAVFKVEVPEGVQCHRVLVDPGPFDLVGKRVPDFKLVDIQGKPWNSEALKGKVAMIHLWRSNADACLPVVPSLEQAYDKFKDNAKVALWAINLDDAQTEAKSIEATARQWKLSLPILRDPELTTPKLFSVSALPATFFLDAKGVLQDCVIGDSPLAAAATTRKLERLLAGGDLSTDALEKFQERIKEDEKEVDLLFSGEVQTATLQQATPTPAAAKSQPVKIHLKPLWKCDAIHPAGNILVVEPPPDRERPEFHGSWSSTTSNRSAKSGWTANCLPITRQSWPTKNSLSISARLSARDGKRYFADLCPRPAAGSPLRRKAPVPAELSCRRLGEPACRPWRRSVRRSGRRWRAEGLHRLCGHGRRAMCFLAGRAHLVLPQSVQCQPRAARSARRKITAPLILCERRLLVGLNSTPRANCRSSARLPGGGYLRALAHADLTHSGQESWCGVVFQANPQQINSGQFTAVGLTPHGEVTWKYPLPAGTEQAVESIVAGRLLPGPDFTVDSAR